MRPLCFVKQKHYFLFCVLLNHVPHTFFLHTISVGWIYKIYRAAHLWHKRTTYTEITASHEKHRHPSHCARIPGPNTEVVWVATYKDRNWQFKYGSFNDAVPKEWHVMLHLHSLLLHPYNNQIRFPARKQYDDDIQYSYSLSNGILAVRIHFCRPGHVQTHHRNIFAHSSISAILLGQN